MKYGAIIDATDIRNSTPLEWAVLYENKRIVNYLIKHGANVNMKDNLNFTALIYAASISEDLVLELLELGADPNVKILDHSETALHISARHGKK